MYWDSNDKRICLPQLETKETLVSSLSREDSLEEEMATHSSILAWEIPRIEESCRLQSAGSQRVRHYLATKTVTTKSNV